MQQLTRAVHTDNTIVVGYSNNEKLRRSGMRRIIIISRCFDGHIADAPTHRISKSLRNRIGMIESRFSTRYSEAHPRTRRQILVPRNFFRAALELMKTVSMKSGDPHNHSTRHTKREVRLVQLRNISAKRNTALDNFSADNPEIFDLAGQNFFEPRCSYRKYLEGNIRFVSDADLRGHGSDTATRERIYLPVEA